ELLVIPLVERLLLGLLLRADGIEEACLLCGLRKLLRGEVGEIGRRGEAELVRLKAAVEIVFRRVLRLAEILRIETRERLGGVEIVGLVGERIGDALAVAAESILSRRRLVVGDALAAALLGE